MTKATEVVSEATDDVAEASGDLIKATEVNLELHCNVCLENFYDAKVPRNLDCGHAICTSCFRRLLTVGSSTCPECRQDFKSVCPCYECIKPIQINIPLLRLARVLKSSDETVQIPRINVKCPNSYELACGGRCNKHGFNKYYRCVRCQVMLCWSCVLTYHLDQPRGSCIIKYIQEEMNSVKLNNLVVLNTHIVCANNMYQKVKHVLRGCNIAMDYFARNSDSEEIHGEDISKIKQEFQRHSESILIALTSLTEAKKQIKVASSWDAAMTAVQLCQSSDKNFRETTPEVIKLHVFLQPWLNGRMDFEELQESGRPVFATLNHEGVGRWCHLEFSPKHVLLFSLRDGNPPEGGIILPYEMVRAAVPQCSPEVFLEVGWRKKVKNVIVIRMFGGTPRSRQTLLLCSGERGPSYRNTTFFGYSEESEGFTILRGGDYENNDGSGGRVIVNDIVNDATYTHMADHYLFCGVPIEEEWRLSTFMVYVQPLDVPSGYLNNVIGKVTSGGYLLKGMRYNHNLQKQKPSVMDCGLIIPYDLTPHASETEDTDSE